jgi:hypothetical protein
LQQILLPIQPADARRFLKWDKQPASGCNLIVILTGCNLEEAEYKSIKQRRLYLLLLQEACRQNMKTVCRPCAIQQIVW